MFQADSTIKKCRQVIIDTEGSVSSKTKKYWDLIAAFRYILDGVTPSDAITDDNDPKKLPPFDERKPQAFTIPEDEARYSEYLFRNRVAEELPEDETNGHKSHIEMMTVVAPLVRSPTISDFDSSFFVAHYDLTSKKRIERLRHCETRGALKKIRKTERSSFILSEPWVAPSASPKLQI
jgi:hypothetical protein